MNWVIEIHEDFAPELYALPKEVRIELLAKTSLLETYGFKLGRPHADVLNNETQNTGSK